MDKTIGYNIISYLKYLYGNAKSKDPKELKRMKDTYHQLAEQTRSIFGINDYRADQPIDTTFNPSSFNTQSIRNFLVNAIQTGDDNMKKYANQLAFTLGIQPQLDIASNVISQAQQQNEAQQKATQSTLDILQGLTQQGNEKFSQLEQQAQEAAKAQTNLYEAKITADEADALGALKAKEAEYKSLLGNNWVDNVISKMKDLMQSQIDGLERMAELAKQAQQAQAEAARAQVNADYAGVIDEIKKAAQEARQMKAEDMNARGMYFSTVLTDALDHISAAEIQQIGKTENQRVAKLAQIAANLAAATANIDIETIKAKSNLVAQYGLQELSLIAQDAKEKATYQAMLAGLEAQEPYVKQKFEALKQSIPDYQKAQEYQYTAPIEQSKTNWELTQAGKEAEIKAQQAQYEAFAPVELQKAIDQSISAFNEFQAKQDQQSFENWLKTEQLNIDKMKALSQMDLNEWQKKNYESMIQLRNAQIGEILRKMQTAGTSGTGTSGTTPSISYNEAMSLLRFNDSLANQLSNLLAQKKAAQDKNLEAQIDKQIQDIIGQLNIMKEPVDVATFVVFSKMNPDQAQAVSAIQDALYQKLGKSLYQENVREILPYIYIDGVPYSNYVKQNPNVKVFIEKWVSSLPSQWRDVGVNP